MILHSSVEKNPAGSVLPKVGPSLAVFGPQSSAVPSSSPDRRTVASDFSRQAAGRFYRNNTLDAATAQRARDLRRKRFAIEKVQKEEEQLAQEIDRLGRVARALLRKRRRALERVLGQIILAAIAIQTVWRGFRERKKWARERAARVIQRHWHQHRVRVKLSHAHKRRAIARERNQRYGYAKRIQSSLISYLHKKRKETRQTKAIIIQRAIRRYLCQKRARRRQLAHAAERRRHQAAIVIQRHVRGMMGRKKCRKLREAVLQIQAFICGRLVHRDYRKRLIALVMSGAYKPKDPWGRKRLVSRVEEERKIAATKYPEEDSPKAVVRELMAHPVILRMLGHREDVSDRAGRGKRSTEALDIIMPAETTTNALVYAATLERRRATTRAHGRISTTPEQLERSKRAIEATLLFEINHLLRAPPTVLGDSVARGPPPRRRMSVANISGRRQSRMSIDLRRELTER